MSYTLNWSDDSLKPPFILNNETVDKQTTSLDLTGKDLSVWGEYIQEDLLRLLENFASRGLPPRSPTIGQFWYDANSDKLYLWDGVSWKTVFTAINTPIWITPKKLTSTSNVNIQLEAKYATEYKTLNLPSALNGSGNGVISGTLIPGVYTFNSNAIAQGVSVPKQFELTIKNTPKLPVWITPAKITIATMPLSIQFEASNTIKYILTGGSFPIGTTFTESGLLSGDCVNDLYNFTITAIGEEGSVEKTFELLVNAPVTTTTTTTAEPSSTSTSTSLQPSNFVWYKPLNGDYAIKDGQFFDGDTYTLNVPLNNTDLHKGAISAGTEGMESLYILSGNLPPGITSNNTQITTLLGSPTTEGTYTFVVRANGYENHINSKGENIINVTFTYIVSNVSISSSTTTTTTTAGPSSTSTSSSTSSPTTYSPIIRFVPSTLTMTEGVETTFMIEVIGMKPNGYFYFNFGNFLHDSNPMRWYTPIQFSRTYGVDCDNVQADINGHWSMNMTIRAGSEVYPDGYTIISGFGSRDPSVSTSPDDVLMHVKLLKNSQDTSA